MTEGSQTPRISSVPSYEFTYGQEAYELAKVAGLYLDDWQRIVLDSALGVVAGRWAAFEVGLIVPRQNGKGSYLEALELAHLFLVPDTRLIMHSAHEFKGLDVDTPILTTSGWSTMGALREGDEVYAPDGQPTKVLGAHPYRYRPCYRVTFDDGQSLVADDEHLWGVFDARFGKHRVLSTESLLSQELVVESPRAGRPHRKYRFRVDLPKPIVGDGVDDSVHPWLLGAWLGDGTTAKGEITVGAEDLSYVISRLDGIGEAYRARPDARTHNRVFTVTVAGLARRLRGLGLLGNKRIPESYAQASTPVRRELLAGLMDTDGTVGDHQIALTLVKRDLLEDAASLARGLGYKVSVREFRASISGHDAGPMWRMQMTASQAVAPFDMPRKRDAVKPPVAGTRATYNAIVAIEPVPIRATRCITVAHESEEYVVGRGFVPTHNTASEHFLRVKSLIEGCPELTKRCKKPRTSHGEEQIETLDGRRLRFMARSLGSGRGFTGDLTVFDEAFKLGSKEMGAMLPTLSAVPNPQVQYTSSAPLIDSEQLASVQERGRARSGKRLAYFEWSAPEEALQDPGNRRYWFIANPALGVRISEEFVEAEQDAMPAAEFARERLGISELDSGSTEIPLTVWRALTIPEEDREARRPGDPLVFAIDGTPSRDWFTIAVAGAYAEGERIQVEVVRSDAGEGWVLKEILALIDKHDPAWSMKGERGVVIDPTSAAGSFIPELEKYGVKPIRTTAQQVAQATGAFVGAAMNDGLRHIGQPELVGALKGARKRDLADGWAWSRRHSMALIAPLVAVTLAAWGVRLIEAQRMDVTENAW